MKLGRVTPNQAMFFSCDIQSKFITWIKNSSDMQRCAERIARSQQILKIPIICSQYFPDKFGHLSTDIQQMMDWDLRFIVERKTYSMLTPEVLDFMNTHKERKSAILFGLEAHITVQQTALDLIDRGYDVHLLLDGISSITDIDRIAALKRMQQSGAFQTSSQSLILEFLKTSDDKNFQELLDVVRTQR